MSSIKDITASNSMPVDLAKRLGSGGVIEILSVMWQGYDDLKTDGTITVATHENSITQEWYIKICNRWYSKNRASRINLNLFPHHQYEDETMARPMGSPPTIDFCFRAWNKNDGYFGAECKNLYDHDSAHIKRYVSTGIENYVSGRYGSCSTVSAMVGYILSGKLPEIVEELKQETAILSPKLNLSRELASRDSHYKSCHTRTLDSLLITLHHLFFDFVA